MRTRFVVGALLSVAGPSTWGAPAAYAQSAATETIEGVVTDEKGAPLPGATVIVASPALGQPQTAITEPDGTYRVEKLPPGEYEVSFYFMDVTVERSDVRVAGGRTVVSQRMQVEQFTDPGPPPIFQRGPYRVPAAPMPDLPGKLRHGHHASLNDGDPSASAKLPLLVMAGVGLGMAVVGGVPIGVTGANPYSIIGAPVIISGIGLMAQSGLTSLARLVNEDLDGVARYRRPFSLEVGGTWVHEAYRERMLMRTQGRVAQGRLELIATGYRSDDGEYQAGDLGARVRILGETRTDGALASRQMGRHRVRAWRGGDFLELRATGRFRDDDADRVKVATIEGEVAGRLGMEHLAPQLRGMFSELALGGGLERAAFRNGHELGGLMLARFGWGMYLGQGNEVQLFYDHRRDSLAGGIAAYRAAGFVGSVGTMVDWRVWGPWALHAELEIGSAWVSTLGIRFEGGAR